MRKGIKTLALVLITMLKNYTRPVAVGYDGKDSRKNALHASLTPLMSVTKSLKQNYPEVPSGPRSLRS